MTVIIVAGFVFALSIYALVALSGIPTLCRFERIIVRALGVCERHGEQPIQFDGATLGTGRNAAAAHERLELVIAGFADEVENRHGRMGEWTLIINNLDSIMITFRRSLTLLLVLVCIGAAYAGYRRISSRPPEIEVTAVRTEDVVRVLAVTGRIKPRLASSVQPLVSGTILTLTKVEGAAVRRGEVLATLDAQTSRTLIQQAAAQLTARKAEAEQKARDYSRLRRLADAGGIAPREAEAANTDLNTAREAVRQLEAQVRELESRSRDFTLKSPIDGYVLSRPVDPGQNVTPQTVVYELATATESEIELEVDEQYLSELKVGLDATVSPLTGERRQYAARIATIGRRVSETSGAVPVRLVFVGKAPSLPAGLSVDVNLKIAQHMGALTVSRAAVLGLGEEASVMLVQNDTLVTRPVQVIDWPSPRIVVLSGVKTGDLVAADPRGIRAGMAVRVKRGVDAF